MVASQDGYLYIYALNLEEGGTCNLINEFQLTGSAGFSDKFSQKEESEDGFSEVSRGQAASSLEAGKSKTASKVTFNGCNSNQG